MKAQILGLVTVSLLGTALAGDQKSSIDLGLQTYADNTYKVVLRFPAELKPDPEIYLDRPYFQTEPRPHVPIRNFQLLVEGNETRTPEESCKGAAEHKLQPFGRNPIIRPMKVDGQNACHVSASKERNEVGALWDAAVFVRYPAPVEMDGEHYSLLEIVGDPYYVLAIARTLKFISLGHESPPFLLDIAPAMPPGTATWKAGAPVFILVTLTNNTEQVLHFPFARAGADYQFDVDGKGWRALLGMTDEFWKLEQERRASSAAATGHEITLKPHETYRKRIEISSLYRLDRPGKDSLQMQMSLPQELGKGLVRSNTLTIAVSE